MSTFPIRCFTCGKPLVGIDRFHNEREQRGTEATPEILDEMNYRRECCRRMFISHSKQLDETLLKYS